MKWINIYSGHCPRFLGVHEIGIIPSQHGSQRYALRQRCDREFLQLAQATSDSRMSERPRDRQGGEGLL